MKSFTTFITENEADDNDRFYASEKKRKVREKIHADAHRSKSHKLMTNAGWELKKQLVTRSEYRHPQHPGHKITVHHYPTSRGEFEHSVDHHNTLAGHIAKYTNMVSGSHFDAVRKSLRGARHSDGR